MRIHNLTFRITGVILAVCFLQMIFLPPAVYAQEPECPYDPANPSLDNARISFKSLNYLCAEQEILDFLKKEGLTIEQRADAHVLLATVYYAKSKNESEKRNLVIEQFKKAFRAYREWRGELDISSTEFIEMMNSAKQLVDTEAAQQLKLEEPVIEEPTVEKAVPGEKKPWYKKWWAIGLGVGVVAGAVVLVAGGGGDDGGGNGIVTDTLPGFPATPGS